MNARRTRARAVLAALVTVLLAVGGGQAASATDAPPAPVEPAPTPVAAGRVQAGGVTADALSITGPDAPLSARVQELPTETGALTGVVHAPDGVPIPGALVSAFRLNSDGGLDRIETVETDSTGAYAFAALPVGAYDLFFNPPYEDPWKSAAWGWRSGGPHPDFSGPVAVSTGVGDAGVQTLGTAAEINGMIKSEARLSPLTGIRVQLWGSNGVGDDGLLDFGEVFETPTEQGVYAFGQVPDGFYLLRFESTLPQYAGEWWRNKSSFATSDILSLSGSGVYVVNANLASRVNLGDVTVSGASATGATLRANHRVSSGTTYRYGWFADGVYIPGASKSTFVPTAAQQHKRITVRITGSKAGVISTTKSSAPRGKTLLTAAPTISGDPSIRNAIGPDTSWWKGSTLTVKPGTWTSGTTLAYQWYADGKALPGATGSRYTLKPKDKGKRITVKVTGSKPEYGTFGRTSAPTLRVATLGGFGLPRDQSATRPPGMRIGPFAWVSGEIAMWQPGTAFTYSFYADSVLVQSGSSPALAGLDRFIGKRLEARVVVSNPGYKTYTFWTGKTDPVHW